MRESIEREFRDSNVVMGVGLWIPPHACEGRKVTQGWKFRVESAQRVWESNGRVSDHYLLDSAFIAVKATGALRIVSMSLVSAGEFRFQ